MQKNTESSISKFDKKRQSNLLLNLPDIKNGAMPAI